MATGVPPQKRKQKKTVPVSLMYAGKLSEDDIREIEYDEFFKSISINEQHVNNTFLFGDNIEALQYLLHNGYREKVKLIYIDPPYATALSFVNRNQEHAYSDELCGGEFVEFLRQRLVIMYDLLAKDGSIYLHLDGKMAFMMKIIMDEIFGEDNCRAFITRKKCSTKNYTKKSFGNISDYIMFYSKSSKYIWNRPYDPWEYEKMIEQYPCVDEKTGRRYKKVPVHAPGVRNGETGKEWRGKMPPKGKHWQYTPQKLDEFDKAGEIYWSATGNPRRMVFCEPDKGIPVQDIWLNYRDSINQSQRTTGYPTEKNFDMLKMIIEASSNVGDLVMDCFSGSGTTLGAAFELGRQWIGVDNSPESLKAILKRFTAGLDVYGDYVSEQKYEQCSFSHSLQEKCAFDIFTTEKDKKMLQMICKDIQQENIIECGE